MFLSFMSHLVVFTVIVKKKGFIFQISQLIVFFLPAHLRPPYIAGTTSDI